MSDHKRQLTRDDKTFRARMADIKTCTPRDISEMLASSKLTGPTRDAMKRAGFVFCEDRYIGHLGKQDNEYDNTLADNASAVPNMHIRWEERLTAFGLFIVYPILAGLLGAVILYQLLK